VSEATGNIVETIRKALTEGGTGSSMPQEILFVKSDAPVRVRLLSEFNEPVAIIMHDKFKFMFPQPCLKYYNEPCPFHGVSGYKTVTWYAWTVWDYDNQEKKIGLWKATLASPIEQLLDLFDANGTIKDRDVTMVKVGTGPKTRVKVKAQPPTPFEGKLSKPYSEEKVMEIVKGLITVRTIDQPAAEPTETEE
jgi:hypothetical protein